MKQKILTIMCAIVAALVCSTAFIACDDGNDGKEDVDDNIEGTYYYSVFNGSDEPYVYETIYIKLEGGMCECSLGWKDTITGTYPPLVCSYTVSDETEGYVGKKVVFNVNEVPTTDYRLSQYFNKTYIWYNGVLRVVVKDDEPTVGSDKLYGTYGNTFCKKGARPKSYATVYYSYKDGRVEASYACPTVLIDGDRIVTGRKFTYSYAEWDSNGYFIELRHIEIHGTCKVSGDIVEFIGDDGEACMYGKVKGRVLYTYSDKSDMTATNWTNRLYMFNPSTDVDGSRQYPIFVSDNTVIEELESSNK